MPGFCLSYAYRKACLISRSMWISRTAVVMVLIKTIPLGVQLKLLNFIPCLLYFQMKEYYIGRCSTGKTVSETGSIPMKLGPFLYYINGYPDRGVSKGVNFSFLKFIFSWRITALQYCVGFCCISTWICHRYTHIPSLLKLPPIPLGCQHQIWASCII